MKRAEKLRSLKKDLTVVSGVYDKVVVEWRKVAHRPNIPGRDVLRDKKYKLESEMRRLKSEITVLETEIKERRKNTIINTLAVVFGIMVVAGIVMLTKRSYIMGEYMLTETHDYISIIKGGGTLMTREVYDLLFTIKVLGGWTLVIGSIGEFVLLMKKLFD